MNPLLQKIFEVWQDGGWVLFPLFLMGWMAYSTAFSVLHFLNQQDYGTVPKSVWKPWISNPRDARGHTGHLIQWLHDAMSHSSDLPRLFLEIRHNLFPGLDERVQWLKVLILAAPLLGLLGTVLGMLSTFHGLAGGSEKMIDEISGGISSALITTELGLLIALPGYLFVNRIQGRRNRLDLFLSRLETEMMQQLHSQST